MGYSVTDALKDRKKRQESQGTSGQSGGGGTLSVSDALKARENRIDATIGSTSEDIFQRYNNLIDIYNESLKNRPTFGVNADDVFQNQRDLRLQAATLYNETDAYRKHLGDEAVDRLQSSIRDMISGQNTQLDLAKYYSQWGSQEEYDKWKVYSTPESRQQRYAQNQARLEELEAQKREVRLEQLGWFGELVGNAVYGTPTIRPYARSADEINREIAAIQAEMNMYERGVTDDTGFYYGNKVVDDYGKLQELPGFAEGANKRDYTNPSRDMLTEYDAMSDPNSWYTDANNNIYDAYGNRIDPSLTDEKGNILHPFASGSKYAVTDRLGLYLGTSEEEKWEAIGAVAGSEGTWENIIKDGYDGNWELLEQNEIDVYYYLLNNSGQEAADKYLSDMKTELNRRNTMNANTRYELAFDEATALERLAMSVATTPAQMFGSMAGFIEDSAMLLTGNDINPYSAAHGGTNFSNVVRSNQAEAFDEATGGAAIPFINFSAGDLYQAGMSAFDMAVGGKLGAGAYEVLMGMGAATQEAKKLYEQGASNAQIAFGGALAGAAEIVAEHASIENLIKLKDADTLGQMVLNLLIQGGIEASEEGITEIANTITNAIVMGSESDWARLVEENGGDYKAAFLQKVSEVGNAAFSGFVSGGLGGGKESVLSYGYNTARNVADGRYINEANSAKALRILAEEMAGAAPDKAQRQLRAQSKRLDEGFMTQRGEHKATGRLYNTVKRVVTEQNIDEISAALQEKGFSKKDAAAIAGAVAVQANGIELTNDQKKVLEKFSRNQDVQSVLTETLDNQESGINKRAKSLTGFAFDTMRGYIASRTNPAAPGQEKAGAEEKAVQEKTGTVYEVSEDGRDQLASDPGRQITVQGIASNENGKLTLTLQDGSTVAAEDVLFGDESKALVYQAVADMGVTTESADTMVKAFNPKKGVSAGIYALDIQEAYDFGKYNYEKKIDENDPYGAVKELAWKEGRLATVKETEAEQGAVETRFQEAEKVLKETGKKVKGEHHAALPEGITEDTLTESQNISYRLADQIAQAAKVNVRVYDGKTGEHGYYDPKTDEIYLNLNAANKSRKSMMAFTLGHELVHRAKKGSPAKFQKFADFLMAEYGKRGSDLDDMIEQEIEAAREHGLEMTRDEAFEEVVADACQRMLLDTDAGKRLAEFGAQSKQNKSLLEDIKRWITEFMEKLRKIFQDVEPDSMAAQEFAKFDEGVKQILADMFVEMTVDAGEKLSAIHAVIQNNAQEISEDEIITDGAVVTDGSGVKYSLKSMKADIAEGQMFEDLKTHCGWTQNQVNELRSSLEDLVAYMTPFRDILDMNESYGREGRRFSPYKPNSDPLYKISMDFSTLCSKRLLTQYVIENLQLRENRPMTAEEQMAIRDMLNEYRKVEKGLQVACAMCYVEAARLKSPKQISKWIDDPETQMRNYFADKNPDFAAFIKGKQADFKESRGYDRNATKKDMSAKDVRDLNKIRPRVRSQYQLTAEEMQIVERAKALPASTYLTAGNLAELSESDPVIYSAYTAFVRTATRSKSLETDEPYYYGDSRRDNGNGIVVSDSFIEAVNRENGMRFSSWSDWRIQHMLDYITAVIDNSVRGAAMHGYTKFGEEVRVLGKTGMMFNMSGVAGSQTGLNEDGSLSFSPTESIDVNEAVQLREEFPETAGLQCIGVNDGHIQALLRSDIIDYVIPYHVSGLNAGLRAMAQIHGWADYTTTQHAAIDKRVKLEDAADKEHWREEPVFSEFFVGYDTGMTGIEAMRASANRYVQMCKDRGLKPKFEQFLKEDNYWKLLIDRKMINQKTGKLIRQRAVTPTFDFSTIKAVVDRHVQNYDSGLEARALSHIVENWDSIPKRIRDLKKQGGKKAKKASKAVDTLANETLSAQPKGVEADGRKFSLAKIDDIRYSLPKTQNKAYRKPAYDEWDVSAALDDALDHADYRDDNMIRVGEMPHFISDMLGIKGDFYIYRNHAYENMVSEKQALKESRPTMRKKKKIHFHDLGKQRMQDAILALEKPIMTIADSTEKENPQIVMILPVEGNNDAPLYAAMSFYDDQPINGSFARRPHLVLTVAERGFESEDGHDGYVDVVNKALKNGRLLSLDKEKMRAYMPVIADHTRVGNIADSALTDNIARFRKEINAFREKNHIDYKLPVGEDTSPRALLANAFEDVVQNDIEKRNLQEYQSNVDMLNAEEAKLQELRAEIYELSFAKGKRDTKKLRDLQFEATHTANRIATLDKILLRFEASAPLQNILTREKEMVRKRERERVKAAAETRRKKNIETLEKREARTRLQKLVLDTAKWISYPKKDDVKCPDLLKAPYADFLNSIDTSSKRLASGGDPTKNDLKLTNAMGSLATALERITMAQDPNQDAGTPLDSGYLDLPAGFVQKLRDMTESIKALMVDGDYVINNMTAQEVRKLSELIRTLNHAIREMSTLYANLRFANIEALGDDSMQFMDDLGEIEKTSGMTDFVEWENALPYYAFRRFGSGGESIFEGLMDAQDKLAFLAQEIFKFQEKTWTGKEAKEWSEDTHTIDLPGEGKLTLTTADAMSIYCLSRRKQGLQHLLGGGARVVGIQKGSKKAKDSRSILSIQDIDAINSSLTDRQREVAEAIQEFMSTVCSDWGNEISMKRFLTREFAEKNYFPIESNDENLPTKDPAAQQSDLFRLLNISATKPVDPRANNEVIIRNIFDVFTNHASDMARLNAFGLPLLDYMKWLNYREKTVNEEGQIKVRGVRKSMERSFGNGAKSYVLNLIKDVNGRASDGGDPSILMKWMRNAKTASVGSSLRVATLQLTSYPRAALVLSPKSLSLGLTKKPNIERAKKYCGIALWKSFGFYDTNISRSIEEQMKGVTDVRQKIIELSLKGAEVGDALTWGVMWNACEYEVARDTKTKIGSEEFYQEVGKKLREVVYATQVVDSTLTRSQIMRSKRGMAQEAAAFMSEPTLSANILMDAGFRFTAERRRTGSAKTAWKGAGKYVGKALAVYSIGQLIAALLEAFWDAWRDDEDEKFGKKYIDAFVQNLVLDLVPFNKIPIVSDVFEAALSMFEVGFYSSDRMSTTWLTQAVSAVDAWKDVLGGNSSSTIYNALYKSARAVSSFLGVSISGVMREGVALWNNTAGAFDSTLKIRSYEPSKADKAGALLDAIIEGDDRQADSLRAEFEDEDAVESAMRSAIKARYAAGEIDTATALKYLVLYSGMDGSEAHWTVEEWTFEQQSDGEDFKKYNEFHEAVRSGENLKTVIKKYTDNGVDLKTLRGEITGHFKPEYVEMTASERAGVKGYLLNAYVACGMKREDAEEMLEDWDFEAKNDFAYSDRRTAYLNGDITAAQLRKALIEYGGYDPQKADAQIQVYDLEDQGYEGVTVSNVMKYNEFCKAAGVPMDAYLEIMEFANNTENDVDPQTGKTINYSAVQKIMAEIAKLPISNNQKEAIALSLWKESTVQKYKLW